MVEYYIGTMGFSYRDWVGSFYPPGTAAKDFLVSYSRVFNAVEIDSTFYGIPRQGSVRRWRDQSPQGFKISLKVPRVITHEAGLVDVEREMSRFTSAVSLLEDKLGMILIQLPPSYDVSNFKTFTEFLKKLPDDNSYAVEFRHPTWYESPVANILAKYNVCWAATEYPGVPRKVERTTDGLFIRLVGRHGRFSAHDREQIDVSSQLTMWWQWIKSEADHVHSVYIFFNDDYSGHAPATANRMKAIMGLDFIKPDIPKQMRFL